MDNDPNPLATGPTKWRAEHCVSHHHGCDCREWEHACRIEQLESELAKLLARIAGAAVGEVGVVQFDVDGYCNEVWTEADTSSLIGQRVALLPVGGV